MTLRAQIATFLVGLLFGLVIFELVRRRKLFERDSVFWLLASVIIVLVPVCITRIEKLLPLLGVFDGNALVFFVALVFLLGNVLVLTVRVTKLSRDQAELVRELALLESRIRGEEERAPARPGNPCQPPDAKE